MLGDFGLAIQQQRELPFLKAGTLDYMAPEVVQVRGGVEAHLGHLLVWAGCHGPRGALAAAWAVAEEPAESPHAPPAAGPGPAHRHPTCAALPCRTRWWTASTSAQSTAPPT